jgi:hypothetical protein
MDLIVSPQHNLTACDSGMVVQGAFGRSELRSHAAFKEISCPCYINFVYLDNVRSALHTVYFFHYNLSASHVHVSPFPRCPILAMSRP